MGNNDETQRQSRLKRPLNAYMLFCQERRSSLLQEEPNLNHKAIMTRLGDLWKAMSSEEQNPYREQARQLQNEFRADCPEYHYRQKKNKAKSSNSVAKQQAQINGHLLSVDPNYLMMLGAQALLASCSIMNTQMPDSPSQIPITAQMMPRAVNPAIQPVSMPPPPPIGSIKTTRTATIATTAKMEPNLRQQLPAMPPPLGNQNQKQVIPAMPPPESHMPQKIDSLPKMSISESKSMENYDPSLLNRPQNPTTRRFGPIQAQSPAHFPQISSPVSMPPPPLQSGMPKMPPPPGFWH